MAQDWETLQEEHTIKAQMSISQRSSMLAPNPTPPPLTRLFCTQALVHVGEYVPTMCALVHNTPSTPSAKTIVALCHLHPLVKVNLLPFVNNFHPKANFILDIEALIYALTYFPHLSLDGPLGMVYELL